MPALPGISIDAPFTGNWVPPSSYGKLLSPPINVPVDFWVGNGSGQVYPQFATDKGQQFGNYFITYGTLGKTPDGETVAFGNNYDQENKYGAAPGTKFTFFSQVEAPNNAIYPGDDITGEFIPLVIPSQTSMVQQAYNAAMQLMKSPTIALNAADMTLLNTIVQNLTVLNTEAESLVAARAKKVELSQGVNKT